MVLFSFCHRVGGLGSGESISPGRFSCYAVWRPHVHSITLVPTTEPVDQRAWPVVVDRELKATEWRRDVPLDDEALPDEAVAFRDEDAATWVDASWRCVGFA
jgi:hypothetical protein